MLVKNWLRLILLGAASALLAPWASAQTPEDPAAIARRDIDQQYAVLVGERSYPAERDEAARRLAQSEAWNRLSEALRGTRVESQLSVAKALADLSRPPERREESDFIDDLARCVPTNRDLAEAACRALVNFKDDPRAVNWLRDFASRVGLGVGQRVAAIRAMGALNDKETARFLVENLLKGDANTQINNAAADALAEMTGLNEFGNDVGQWDQWWRQQRDKAPERFRDERRAAREAEMLHDRNRRRELARAITNFVADSHRVITDEKQREAYLLGCLKNPQPEFRAAGAQLVTSKKAANENISPAIIEQLRGMIGDSAPEVRRPVAEAVKAINDPDAVPAILAQLQRERIPSVKAALVDALAPTKDISSVEILLGLLNDPSFQVAEAAARSLAALSPEIAKDPGLSRRAADAVSAALERTRRMAGSARLREALVDALVPLKDASLMKQLFSMLPERPENTTQIRRNAIRALAGINAAAVRADIASNIVSVLARDSEPGVRLEAAKAMGIVGTPEQAQALRNAINPAIEPDPHVREAAWNSVSSLFDKFDIRTLNSWGADPFFSQLPEKKLTIYLALNAKAIALGREEDKALAQEQIGTIYLNDLGRPDDAIPYLKGAMPYWEGKPAGVGMVSLLQSRVIRAYFQSRRYKDAVQFAADRIIHDGQPDAQNVESIGTEFYNEAKRLDNAKRMQDALSLIEEFKGLAITGRIRDQMLEMEKVLRTRPQNYLRQLWPEWWDQSYAALGRAPLHRAAPWPARGSWDAAAF